MDRAQVWIETVIYTLVGLALIGFALSLVLPKINDYRDRGVVESTLTSFDKIDEKLVQVLSAPGNIRVVDFVLKRGYLTVDSINDQIIFQLNDSTTVFSEPGITAQIGRVNVTTSQNGKKYSVVLVLPVDGDVVLKDSTEPTKTLAPATIPYKLSFENVGLNSQGKQIIAFKEASGA